MGKEEEEETKKVVVVGGGLVGAVVALGVADLGFKVKVIERREDFQSDGPAPMNAKDRGVVKRSINLALSHRGEEALKKVGAWQDVQNFVVPMYGRAIHTKAASVEKLWFQPYDETDSSNFIKSVSREKLNSMLLQKAEKHPNIEVIYGQQLLQIDRNRVLHFKHSSETLRGSYCDCFTGDFQIEGSDLIIGADGAYSAVRESMLRLQTTNFCREYIEHGYKELDIGPSENNGGFQLENPNSLHIWPRGEFMMIALPNPDKSFTCTLFAPMDELDALQSEKQIEAYFEEHFPDIIPYIPDFVSQFKKNPACRLVMSRVDPWHLPPLPSSSSSSSSSTITTTTTTNPSGDGHVVLIGDAAHACVPFYGQGMNAGMEDALELIETLEQNQLNLDKSIPKFSNQRRPRGNAIIDLSLRNYIEMRSHTASRLFLLRKKLEGALNWMFPTSWVPLYKMVAFTRTPYDEAIARESRQEKILTVLTTATISCVALGFIGLVGKSMKQQN